MLINVNDNMTVRLGYQDLRIQQLNAPDQGGADHHPLGKPDGGLHDLWTFSWFHKLFENATIVTYSKSHDEIFIICPFLLIALYMESYSWSVFQF